jgi:hypothetical protein
MTAIEFALFLGQPKGIENRKLITAPKPVLLLPAGSATSEFLSAENIRNAREIKPKTEGSEKKQNPKKNEWIEKDHKNKIPNLDKRTPFIPNQNDLPF